MRRFDPLTLISQVSALPRSSQAAFALACAERLAASAPSSKQLTDKARSLTYHLVSGEKMEESVVAEMLVNLRDAVDLDEDVHAAAFYALDCFHRDAAQSAVYAAQRAYDHYDLLAQSSVANATFDKDVEVRLLAHPAVQAELKHQASDLHELVQGTSSPQLVASRANGSGSAA